MRILQIGWSYYGSAIPKEKGYNKLAWKNRFDLYVLLCSYTMENVEKQSGKILSGRYVVFPTFHSRVVWDLILGIGANERKSKQRCK